MKLDKIDKCFFINLDKRKDRLEHIIKTLPFYAQRFRAVDANGLELTPQIHSLFKNCIKKLTKAEIACSLSHYSLWKNLVADENADNYLILEDDVVFKPGFQTFWNNAFADHFPDKYNLIYLGGCQPWNKPQYHKVLKPQNQYFYNIKKNDFFNKEDHYFHMNAQSYIISKQGASLICQYVEQLGFDLEKAQAQDVFMINFFNKNKFFEAPESIFHLYPSMSYQLHEENDNTEIDKKSDLRHATEKFNNTNKKISVIIPTVWKSLNYMSQSLMDLDKVNCIEEVIVIDNDKSKTPNWINKIKKVKLVDSGKRMYFNESVNFGINLCKNDICCIYNDDIISDTRIFDYIKNNSKKKDGCIFMSPEYINTKKTSSGKLKNINNIYTGEGGLPHGSGMLMFARKNNFIKIPKDIVHHFGDNFMFKINQKQGFENYYIEGFPIQTPRNGGASSDINVDKIIKKDWEIHKKIFNNLNKFLPQNEKTFTSLTELLIPLKTNLTKKRIGGKGDGGYVLLKEIFDESDTVYSYGIDDSKNSDSFDLECADQNKIVFMFDGTINRSQSKNPRLIFTKQNLTADNFRSHLLINNNISKENMILKMDIEGCEYPIIEKNIDLISKCFSMACIEFHGLNNPTFYNFKNKNKILELMLQKYDIFHMHANNWVERKFTVPNVMEISFVRKGFCLNEPDCKYPIKNLDFPNCNNRKDYVLDWWVGDAVHFPNLSKMQHKEIPKKIHLSWKDKNVLGSNHQLIKKGAKNLEILNPDWDIHVYDDEDINRTLRDSIGLQNWNLIKDRKITEKTDLWRLIKIYKEGGLYVDIDRYIDTPIDNFVDKNTSLVLPICNNIDFSQDFILSHPKSEILGKAISNNIKYRKLGKSLFFLAVNSYMHSVTEVIGGTKTERSKTNKNYFENLTTEIEKSKHIKTYLETGAHNHILFRNKKNDFKLEEFKKDKADFYNAYNVKHWNYNTEKAHQLHNKLTLIWQVDPRSVSQCFETDWIREIFSELDYDEIVDCNFNIMQDNCLIIYNDIHNKKENNNHTSKLHKYLDKASKKNNVSILHLGDEFTHARTSHYKDFDNVIRTTFNKNVSHMKNVLQIPLGYKQGFHD